MNFPFYDFFSKHAKPGRLLKKILILRFLDFLKTIKLLKVLKLIEFTNKGIKFTSIWKLLEVYLGPS